MKQEIIKFMTKTGNFLVKNSPHIFTGLAVAGVVGTVALVIKAQHDADDIVTEEETERIANDEDDNFSEFEPVAFKERLKMTWKCYIPAAISGVSTIAFIIASDTVNTKRLTAVSALYAASQKTLEEYKEHVKEAVDNKTFKDIKSKKIDEALEKNPIPDDKSVILRTNGGNQLCLDMMTGQYFYSDPNTINAAVNMFNHRLNIDYQLSFNDWVEDYLGIRRAMLGDYVGYNSNEPLEIDISYRKTSLVDQSPLLILDYATEPKQTYRDW